ncbi:MAG TPA: hypothetical protein PKE45_11055 [Caldilineaceae bacterium]|nr:hypothetical protein [Caldilineaceae bacterium]
MSTNFQTNTNRTPWFLRSLLAGLIGVLLLIAAATAPVLAADEVFPQPEQLTVTVQNDQVVLDWLYTVEPSALTYTLARSENRSLADATVVNASLLSSTGDGEPVVAYYTLIDTTAQPGRGYAYWLTATDEAGQSLTLGPLTIGQVDDASERQTQLFLPIVTLGG